MSYQIIKQPKVYPSLFFVGVETGALYIESPRGMVCIDANGTGQIVGVIYPSSAGQYRVVEGDSKIVIEVGK